MSMLSTSFHNHKLIIIREFISCKEGKDLPKVKIENLILKTFDKAVLVESP